MATYDMGSYCLQFSSDFKKLRVCTTEGCDTPTAEYALDAASTSVNVAVDGDDYVITTATALTSTSFKIDVGAGAELAFNAATFDGVGVVDLRDIKVCDPGPNEISLDLNCTPMRMQYVPGPFALRVYLENPNCLTSTNC